MNNFIYFDEIDSTNDWCKKNINSLKNKTCVVADKQTKGRGSHGRNWESPLGNIYMSYVYSIGLTNDSQYFPLFISYSVIKTLEKFLPNANLTIKWPNDILLNNKKIGGILMEVIDNNDKFTSIIGIGINLVGEIITKNSRYNISTIYSETNIQLDKKIIIKDILLNNNNTFKMYEHNIPLFLIKFKHKLNFKKNDNIKLIMDCNIIDVKFIDILDNGIIEFIHNDSKLNYNLNEIKFIENI